METSDNSKNFDAEIEAMKLIAKALQGLEEDVIKRVLRWASDRYEVKLSTPSQTFDSSRELSNEEIPPNSARFDDLADLFSAASPSKDIEKALVVGYWIQYIEGFPDFDSQSINKELKQLGYGISNITRAFELLKGTKPSLVVQMKKGGTSKQARKRLKLTNEGKKAVEAMLGQQRAW